MKKILSFINEAEGIKRYLLAFFFGCLVTLALPPVYIIPAAILGFVAHLWQMDTCKNKKQAFWLGWWFGWGYFTSGLYWIAIALLTDVAQFGWMIPFAVFGIPAVLAFYTGAVSLLTFVIPQKDYARVIVFAVLWTLIEMLRGYLFTGFPWNLIGYMWTVSDSMLQLASVTGIWGLSFFTVFAFSMPYSLIGGGRFSFRRSLPTIIAFSILFAIWIGGVYRLSGAQVESTGKVVRIVQGNISQDNKWDSDLRSEIVQKYLDMTYSKGIENVNMVVWPESAVPYFIEEGSALLAVLKEAIPKNGFLITGSMHAERLEHDFVGKVWNSMHVIDHNGKIVGLYNKHHLVPFGEYVPLRGILPINKITQGTSDFAEGDGVQTLHINGLPPFSPLICYEAIFPGAAVDEKARPEVIINVTNDAWYGNSSGPYQHFNMVRVRAVEEGVPLIRAANTGISGIIDPYGRVVAKTTLGKNVVLDENLPVSLASVTIYGRFGDSIIFIIIFLYAFFISLEYKIKAKILINSNI
jgi:apolipoprotein N-acyltransferase